MLTEDSEADDMCLKCSDIIIITMATGTHCMLTEDSEADDMCLKCSDIIIITMATGTAC